MVIKNNHKAFLFRHERNKIVEKQKNCEKGRLEKLKSCNVIKLAE